MRTITSMKKVIIFLFLLAFIWSAFGPASWEIWFLEISPVILGICAIVYVEWKIGLSTASVILLGIYLLLPLFTAHYGVAHVPIGEIISDLFGYSRNVYDRVLHLSFGLFLFYPMRDVYIRIAKKGGVWSYIIPAAFIFALSALYEVGEWLAAIYVDPAAGVTFLGAQGDFWDTQKDMAIAGLGMLIAVFVTWIASIRNKKR